MEVLKYTLESTNFNSGQSVQMEKEYFFKIRYYQTNYYFQDSTHG